MQPTFIIENHTVHLWRAWLPDLVEQETHFLKLLSQDELQRANRFRFPQHKTRFILARGMLREILSRYTNIAPQLITFEYGQRGKPALQGTSFNLQFNVSHSEEAAVFAFTNNVEIGVDIQKIEEKHHEAVAKRFFSTKEYMDLQQLSELERPAAFCELWAAKEALIKAMGEGLYVALGDFSVKLHQKSQWVELTHNQTTQKFYLENFSSFLDYQSAFATNQTVDKVIYWEWALAGPHSC